ncbi:non-canonical purine NTP pyrophosphatase, RdgB/HAM1 family [Bdellovibrio sp. ZAP7]|uniref:RdgB/HAM1 family non-canonical purine NTP pyrophosphatase n=1 Tax=Bdellovibrio sp. ZAP7 TaxID=2231053 RepID=UPI00115C110C|nr:RdgB/HAM1 family non-canonical purine NTP pyrophosphatase [Bdellovibrio sp. ZAP7]QDK44813.1 non-canonical purine NTP pyrophosphatase, RdgB/HAM1 family [Bdellovibrio sp. ZAP7]
MELWIATGNKGKLTEYRILLNEVADLNLHHQGEITSFTPRPEDGKTFLDNARIKAKTLRAVKNNVWVLGEDAGLEVEGLNNLPGIHSARYAGPKASDSENVSKLLKMITLKPMANKNAKFVCTTVVYTPTGEEWVFTGEMKGTIASKPAGLHGFGYDPVFIPEGQTQTLAELASGFKAQHSHRAQATKQFLAKLKETGNI